MENEDWFRDIENAMSDYFNQHMNNRAPSQNNSPGFASNNANNRSEMSEHRMYMLINEFMQDYYATMRAYQHNMRDVIQLLREFRTTPPNVQRNQSFSHEVPPPVSRPPVQNPLPSTANNVPLATASFAYFIQPFTREHQEAHHLTNEQIEHAVERIVYNASMTNAYNENTANTDETIADRCPICLEDFQIGEQVLRIRVCGHIFKRPGLLRWFQRNNHCPVCRRNVNEIQPPVEEEPSMEEPSQTEDVQEQPEQTPRPRLTPTRAINHLVENHIRNPLMREFGSFIQNLAQSNRDGRTQFAFFDLSLNPQL